MSCSQIGEAAIPAFVAMLSKVSNGYPHSKSYFSTSKSQVASESLCRIGTAECESAFSTWIKKYGNTKLGDTNHRLDEFFKRAVEHIRSSYKSDGYTNVIQTGMLT